MSKAIPTAECVKGDGGEVPVAVLVSGKPLNKHVEELEHVVARAKDDKKRVGELHGDIITLERQEAAFRGRLLSPKEQWAKQQIRDQIAVKRASVRRFFDKRVEHDTTIKHTLYKVCLLLSNTVHGLRRAVTLVDTKRTEFEKKVHNIVTGFSNLQAEKEMWVQIAKTKALAVEADQEAPMMFSEYSTVLDQKLAIDASDEEDLPEPFRDMMRQLDAKLELARAAQDFAKDNMQRLQAFSHVYKDLCSAVENVYCFCTDLCVGSPAVWRYMHLHNDQIADVRFSHTYQDVNTHSLAKAWTRKHGIDVNRTIKDKTLLTMEDMVFVTHMHLHLFISDPAPLMEARKRLEELSGSDKWDVFRDK